MKPLDQGVVIGLGTYSFLLQNYYVAQWAGNSMMHLLVDDLEAWWGHIATLDLPAAMASPLRSRRN